MIAVLQVALTAAVLASVVACSGPKVPTEPLTADAVTEEAPAAQGSLGDEVITTVSTEAPPVPVLGAANNDGASCLSAADCGDGMVCEGLGCDDDQPGTCKASARPCTRDLRPYCGCDGTTFLSSGSCPGNRYQAAMPCPGDPGSPAAGGPPSSPPPSPQ